MSPEPTVYTNFTTPALDPDEDSNLILTSGRYRIPVSSNSYSQVLDILPVQVTCLPGSHLSK